MVYDEEHEPLIRVSALHALEYCERLFYLEEVEELRVADANVYAGRTLHIELAAEESDSQQQYDLSSERLGLAGKLDALRHREGWWFPYEHKRGRCARGADGTAEAWPSDRLQISAYGMLLEDHLVTPIREGRVRYHASKVTVRVPLDTAAREAVLCAVTRARKLRSTFSRPAISTNARLCIRCSLAPVCLPEEERLRTDPSWEPVRLFPADAEGQTVHVVSHSARIGRSGESITVQGEGADGQTFPVRDLAALVLHGSAQITTQALHLCAAEGVAVHWITGGGSYVGALAAGTGQAQRRIRQYHALADEALCTRLARRLTLSKLEGQLRFILRATRGRGVRGDRALESLAQIRGCLRAADKCESRDSLRGHEGLGSRAYFEVVGDLLIEAVPGELRPTGRSRRPPKDRFNALLSFGYALLYRSVLGAILAVGIEPAIGFYHTARSSALPLALDLMELFRVSVWDMPIIASLNRKQWDVTSDFNVTGAQVWLSDAGRRKAIHLYEERLGEVWRHPVMGYSLSYARTMELEVRLLEKEWTGKPGLFARARIR